VSDTAADAWALHQVRAWVSIEAFHHRMRSDPAWAAQVAFCCRVGIPLSEFLGRVPDPGEPRWLDEDRDVAVGFERWSTGICPGCGLHRLDWLDERDETWKGTIEVCHGCVEIGDTRATIPKKVSDERRAALRVYLTPRTARERILLEAHERGEIETDDLPDGLT
jgi:hypothetical protein